MNKAKIENYLRLYPGIDDDIIQIGKELEDLKKRKQILIDNEDMDTYSANSLLETIDAAILSAQEEFDELFKANKIILKTYYSLSPMEKQIIRIRFWNGRPCPTPWNKIAKSMNYHRTTLENIYKKTLEKMLN